MEDLKRLWEQARKNAIVTYEEEYGAESWNILDKYEKEDYVWDAYEQLRNSLKCLVSL